MLLINLAGPRWSRRDGNRVSILIITQQEKAVGHNAEEQNRRVLYGNILRTISGQQNDIVEMIRCHLRASGMRSPKTERVALSARLRSARH